MSPHGRESGFVNPRNFCLWNPESWALESRLQFKEFGIPLTIGIRNPSSTDKESGIQYLESEIHVVESRIHDFLGFPCMGKNTYFISPFQSSEIDECDSNPCHGNSNCTDLIADFLCSCQPGFTGKQCETNIDDCQDQPCFNNGTCHDLVDNYTCTCRQGYQGSNCEDDVDECTTSPCSNNASCSNYPGGYNCQCRSGFTGKLCETDVDECELSPCLNGATCRDGINNYTCLCATGKTK